MAVREEPIAGIVAVPDSQAAADALPTEASLVDLRELRGSDLAPLLDEQAAYWRCRYAWDFRSSAHTLRGLLDRHALRGSALVSVGRPVGYSYFVPDGRRAVVGDLFVSRVFQVRQAERRLLESALNAACTYRGVERVEGQLMCLTKLPALRPALLGKLEAYPRVLMLRRGPQGPPAQLFPRHAVSFSGWSPALFHTASELIAVTYRGHVDARINEQYGSAAGARRFLLHTIQQRGAGRFFEPAAIVARGTGLSELCGLCLGSLVGEGVGHVTQLCVAPSARRRGVGYELLRRSLEALREAGCAAASLTVTASNTAAVRLYERSGFHAVACFPAFVWQRT